MIQEAFNGMIALMLAKFVLNDVPHAMGHFEEPYHKPRQHKPEPVGKIIAVPGGAEWRCAKCGVLVKPGGQVLRLGGKIYCVECARSGNPTGTCYPNAWRFLVKHEGDYLIHGSVQLSAEGPRVNHAWVETTYEHVWEPQTRQYFRAEDFSRMFAPIEDARYNAEEAAIMLARAGKHGPWNEEERHEYIGR